MSKKALDHYSRLGRLKVERHQLEKKIDAAWRDMGQRVYTMKKDGLDSKIAADAAVESFIKDVDDTYEEIAVTDEKIGRLNKDENADSESASEKEEK
ncbi:MAG: hypothetical protein ACQEQ4_00070 [Fibrobacterota bacterium]